MKENQNTGSKKKKQRRMLDRYLFRGNRKSLCLCLTNCVKAPPRSCSKLTGALWDNLNFQGKHNICH